MRRVTRCAVALLLLAVGAAGFPVYTSLNGSVTLESAFGGDVVFAPSAGGAFWSRESARPLSECFLR